MPLHDSFKTNSGANMRLSKLSAVPSEQDLMFAMNQAGKNPRAVIELPWKTSTSPVTFVLKVSVAQGSDEGPLWTLYNGDTPDSGVLWSHESMDPFLIQSLIAAECDPSRSLNTYVDTSKPAPIAEEPQTARPPERPTRSALHVDLPKPVELDKGILDALQLQLRRKETGLYSEASFYFFLIQEFNRFQRSGLPVALILFDMSITMHDGRLGMPPLRVLHEAAQRIAATCRNLDILCHYKDPILAILLPHTSTNEALPLASRLQNVLLQSPLAPGLDSNNVVLHFGVAAIPDTCDHPGVLIAAAHEALDQGKRTNNSIVLFPSA